MKAQFETVPARLDRSFHIHRAVNPSVDISWHYHSEMEITYIRQGRGTRYVGNNVARFEPGELVLIGPNVPHSWKNDDEYYQADGGHKHEDWVIQFDQNFWGEHFISLPEMEPVKKLFDDSERGIVFHFNREMHNEAVILFDQLFEANPFMRLQLLLQLIGLMAQNEQSEYLNSSSITKTTSEERRKMLKIHDYVTNNFLKEIKLEEAANLAGMSVSGFCRNFKRINRKTFIEYVNEVRIAHACRLLREKAISVTASCYDSGFNNFSNFSKQFKKVTGLSPGQYRKKHR